MEQVNVRVGHEGLGQPGRGGDDPSRGTCAARVAAARLSEGRGRVRRPRGGTRRRRGPSRLMPEGVRRVLPPARPDLGGRGASHRSARGGASRAPTQKRFARVSRGPASAWTRRGCSRSSRTRRASRTKTPSRSARRYFHLGIACPFLEDESCSIHADRPISCREYLVTSPAVNCADPKPGIDRHGGAFRKGLDGSGASGRGGSCGAFHRVGSARPRSRLGGDASRRVRTPSRRGGLQGRVGRAGAPKGRLRALPPGWRTRWITIRRFRRF